MAEQAAESAAELPDLVEGIKAIFTTEEVLAYLGRVQRVGPLGHAATDEVYGVLRAPGASDENPVRRAVTAGGGVSRLLPGK